MLLVFDPCYNTIKLGCGSPRIGVQRPGSEMNVVVLVWLRCGENAECSVYVPEVVYTLLPIDCVHDSQSATDSRLYTYCIVSFFLLAYALKRPNPFFLIYTPQKNPLLVIKYELSTSCRWCFRT